MPLVDLPIDLVIPTTLSGVTLLQEAQISNYRESFWQHCPTKVCWIDNERCEGNANVKRNYGARQGNSPFLFFCDDDVVLKPGALLRMLEVLVRYGENTGYVYCNFLCINHPCIGTAVHFAGPFSKERLLHGDPYISTMSLMRRSAFGAVGGFDEKIERLQDYGLFLHMLQHGITGVHIPEVLFAADYTNSRITKKEGFDTAWAIIKSKYVDTHTCERYI